MKCGEIEQISTKDFAILYDVERTMVFLWCRKGFLDWAKVPQEKGMAIMYIQMTDKTLAYMQKREERLESIQVRKSDGKTFDGDYYLYRNDAMGGYLAMYYQDLVVERQTKGKTHEVLS